ncbi:hypothetical protein JCM8097_001774 [Rhodosporidiobolus ruineniae]
MSSTHPHHRPHLQSHHRSSSAPSISPPPIHPAQQANPPWKPRKPAPAVRPVFPPSPPLSPEVVQAQLAGTEASREKGKEESEAEREEEEQLRRALEASMREDAVKQGQDHGTDLDRALAESRALEAVREQRRSREEDDLAAALLASQQSAHPPSPPDSDPSPSTSSASPYRPRSASLPSFSPADLAYSTTAYRAEKARAYPESRPPLPPGAGSAWDEESREMEMLALAIRISEEEERERRRIEKEEEERLVDMVRKAERDVFQGRGMLPPGAAPAPSASVESSFPSSSSTSSHGLTPVTSTGPTTASTSLSTSTSAPPPSRPEKDKRRASSSWFRPPLASTLSSAPASPPRSPPPPPRPELQPKPLSPPVHSFPFSNLEPIVHRPAQPSKPPPVPPHPPRAAQLPHTPPETPQAPQLAFPSSQPVHLVGSSPFLPPSSSSLSAPAETEHLLRLCDERERQQSGSPFEMPYLTPSNSVRSTYPSGSGRTSVAGGTNGSGSGSGSGSGNGSGSGGRERERTLSAVTARSGRRCPNSQEHSHSPTLEDGAGSVTSSVSGDDADAVLAVRNPDGASAASTATRESSDAAYSAHSYASSGSTEEGELYSTPYAGPLPASYFPPSSSSPPSLSPSASPAESLWAHDRPRPPPLPDFAPGDGFFESAYAGRSMSQIDEMTEPASSVVGLEGGETRQGSFPSTLGGGAVENSADSPDERKEREVLVLGEGMWVGGGGGGGGAGQGTVLASSPELLRSSVARPPYMSRTSSASSATSGSHYPPTRQASTRQQHYQHYPQQEDQPVSFPLSSPNLVQQPPPSVHPYAQPEAATSFASTAATTVLAPPSLSSLASASALSLPLPQPHSRPASHRTASSPPSPPPGLSAAAREDGLRFGYPAACAREPGHSCPQDGLDSGTAAGLGEAVELSLVPASAAVGLGFKDAHEQGGGRKDAFAIEARSWIALLRFLMWYGDTQVVPSSSDVAAARSTAAGGRCAAAASLEFRPDDEGVLVLRLTVQLLTPEDGLREEERELSVFQYSPAGPAGDKGKGKGKQRAASPCSSSAGTTTTYHLPDVLHLPARLSSLAIQLYTLRHLASIARATQPARSPPPLAALSPSSGAVGPKAEGYLALRALADSIADLGRAARERQRSAQPSREATPRGPVVSASPVPVPASTAEDANPNQRLVDRLRDRLRRLKRHSGADENAAPSSSAAASGLPPLSPATQQTLLVQTGTRRSSKLVKP